MTALRKFFTLFFAASALFFAAHLKNILGDDASMSAKKKDPDFDAKLTELQRIVARLEGENLPLETGVALFKEGVALAKSCRKQLEAAKNEVMLSSKGLLEPFDLDADAAKQSQDQDRGENDEGLPF